MKTIILVLKGKIEGLPPFMSLAIELSLLNHKVILITSDCDEKTKLLLRQYNIEVVVLQSTKKTTNKFSKVFQWLSFRKKALAMLSNRDYDYLWIGGGDTALAFGSKLLSLKYILTLYELYDTNKMYKYFLKPIIQSAHHIVVPERNRAAIIRSWYSLTRTPFIIPNKPYLQEIHPSENIQLITASSNNKKIALYQGHIGSDRDLEPICNVFNELIDSWQLVLMGKNHGYLHELNRLCPSLIHIDHINAPEHLSVTQIADIGLVSYTYQNLNNVFCAPNKIWEYSSFNKPMIGNDVPGLIDTVSQYRAGKCVDFSNEKVLKQAILEIEKNYDNYSLGARNLFNSIDTVEVLEKIIK